VGKVPPNLLGRGCRFALDLVLKALPGGAPHAGHDGGRVEKMAAELIGCLEILRKASVAGELCEEAFVPPPPFFSKRRFIGPQFVESGFRDEFGRERGRWSIF
jgi:hypothetical protein